MRRLGEHQSRSQEHPKHQPCLSSYPGLPKNYLLISSGHSERVSDPKSEVRVCDIGEVLHTSTLVPIDTTDMYLKRIISLVLFFFKFMVVFTPNMALTVRLRPFPFAIII